MIQKIKEGLYKALRRSERYTKTDMIYLVKGSFWLTFGSFITSGTVFLSAIAFAYLLPKDVYGTYKYILSMFGMLSIATLGGMEGAVGQAVARNYEGSFIPAIKVRMQYGLLGSVASIGMAGYYFIHQQPILAGAFLIAAVFLPIMDPLAMYHNYLQNKKLFDVSAIYGAIAQIIAVGSLIITIFITKNLLIILFVYLGSWTLLRYIFLRRTLKDFPPNTLEDPQTISYGKHSTTINIIATLIGSLDSIMLFNYLGPSELAIYSFALAPIAQLRSLSQNLPTLAMPKLAGKSAHELDRTLNKRIILLFTIAIAIVSAYILTAPYIFKIFFPQYISSVFFSQVFSISLLFTMPQDIFGAVIGSKLSSTPKKLLYLWNVPTIVLVVSMFLLISRFGILGVILSRIFSAISVLIINWILWISIKKVEAARA